MVGRNALIEDGLRANEAKTYPVTRRFSGGNLAYCPHVCVPQTVISPPAAEPTFDLLHVTYPMLIRQMAQKLGGPLRFSRPSEVQRAVHMRRLRVLPQL